MEFVKVGMYKEREVYITEIGPDWYISFGQDGYKYWLGAINNIIDNDLKSEITDETTGLEIKVNEIKPLVAEINNLRNLL